jgi:hypothetical protein
MDSSQSRDFANTGPGGESFNAGDFTQNLETRGQNLPGPSGRVNNAKGGLSRRRNPPFTHDKTAGYAGACHRAALCADPLGYNPPYALLLIRADLTSVDFGPGSAEQREGRCTASGETSEMWSLRIPSSNTSDKPPAVPQRSPDAAQRAAVRC